LDEQESLKRAAEDDLSRAEAENEAARAGVSAAADILKQALQMPVGEADGERLLRRLRDLLAEAVAGLPTTAAERGDRPEDVPLDEIADADDDDEAPAAETAASADTLPEVGVPSHCKPGSLQLIPRPRQKIPTFQDKVRESAAKRTDASATLPPGAYQAYLLNRKRQQQEAEAAAAAAAAAGSRGRMRSSGRHSIATNWTARPGQTEAALWCNEFKRLPIVLELQCSDFPASLKAALRASRSRQSRTNGCGLGGGFSFELFCVLVGCLKNRRKKSRFSIGASAPAGGPSVAYRRRSSVGVGFGRWRRPSLRRGVVVVGGGAGGRPLLSDEPRCSVFLGGACNPTTWRSDTAVPFLVKERISFYNPQVDSWYPQLIDIENTAKDNASVLLFVLDPRTRGIASIVESAYLAGQGRNLVLVIPDACTTGKSRIANCRWEQESIHRSLLFLIDLVERCQIPVFDSLPAALQAVKTLVKQRQSVTKLSPDDGVSPVWDSAAPVSRTLTLLWELFRCHDTGRTGRISADAAGLILETMSGGVGGGVIGRRRNDCDSFDMSVLPEPGQAVSFADLCLLYSSESGREDWTDWLWSALAWPLAFAKRLLTGPASALSAAAPIYDVFLGGTCGRSRWRDDAAIPRLQAAGISYYNPQ
uniref:EF-hand domain-containing protein n=1 Tax=Macrostomum lignano TaxID=282301 RepID=A0A1I8F361_9PLAT